MDQVNGCYGRALRFVLSYPLALAAGCVILIVASFFCYRALGAIFCLKWTREDSFSTTSCPRDRR